MCATTAGPRYFAKGLVEKACRPVHLAAKKTATCTRFAGSVDPRAASSCSKNDESIWISFVSARAGREESHWINSVSAPHVGEFVMCAAHHCAKTFSQQHGVLVLKEIHEGCN